MSKFSYNYIVFAFIALLLITNIAYAELVNEDLPNRKGLKIERLMTVHAAFKKEMQLDTNVFLTNKSEKTDLITILNPSVGFEMKLGDHKLSMDYDYRANLFAHHNRHNFVDQRIRVLGEINLTDWKLRIWDTFKHFSDRAGSEDTSRIKRRNNYLGTDIEAEFEQLGIKAGYVFGVEDFLNDDSIYKTGRRSITYNDKDRVSHVFSLGGSYRFLPKTSAILENEFGLINYASSYCSDSWYIQTMLGLRGDLRDDFTVNIKGGIRYQDYKSARISSSKDYFGPVFGGGATYYMTDDDIFELLIEGSIYESTFQNLNYYHVNHAGLTYTHYFNKKLSASLGTFYQLNLYPASATVDGVTDKRYDHIFGGNAEVRYEIRKWATVKAGYEYKQRRSRFGVFDYTDNIVSLSGTVGF